MGLVGGETRVDIWGAPSGSMSATSQPVLGALASLGNRQINCRKENLATRMKQQVGFEAHQQRRSAIWIVVYTLIDGTANNGESICLSISSHGPLKIMASYRCR